MSPVDEARAEHPDDARAARMAPAVHAASRWSIPILRVSMAVFLIAWGLDKLVAVEGSVRIFDRFYGMSAGPSLIQVAGVAEILLGLALGFGWMRRPIAWVVLIVNGVSTIASWRQILDPWGIFGIGPGGSHLFLASIVLTAVAVVLVLEAEAARRLQ